MIYGPRGKFLGAKFLLAPVVAYEMYYNFILIVK